MAWNDMFLEGELSRPAFVLLNEHICSIDVHCMVKVSIQATERRAYANGKSTYNIFVTFCFAIGLKVYQEVY
jgi:hypothetical protein